MNLEEAKKALEELRQQGHDDEEIVKVLYKMFQDGKLKLEEFEGLAALCGYELTDEFKNADPEKQKTMGEEDVAEGSDAPKGDELYNEKGEPEVEPDKAEPEKEDKDPEESDEDKAMKLYGFQK